jgi:acetyl-CoA carboxylase biotin carboxyl carrier protein
MDIKKIKEFIELAKSEGVSELKYEEKEVKIAVSFQTSNFSVPQIVSSMPTTGNTAAISEANDPNIKTVTSPFVGTFYLSSSPDKDPYVSIGAKITKGSTLCILEAMKIMNEIESDVSGEVIEVCAENESLVEFGQVLFRIRV